MAMLQAGLFADADEQPMHEPAPGVTAALPQARTLPVLGEQKDIVYHGVAVKGILNGPETTGMGFRSINPYTGCAFGCAYCYARYAHRYAAERAVSAGTVAEAARAEIAAMPFWLAFERHIFVKQNAPERLRAALRAPAARDDATGIVIGTATDPYQPAERRFRLTRGILEALAEHAAERAARHHGHHGNPGSARLSVSIITKSPLVTRDVDVLARLAQHARVRVHLSLITLDRELARRLEPRAPTPESRLRALARLREAGIDAGVNVMPVLPGITDQPAALEALVASVARAGATHVNACALRLQSTARQRYLPFIEAEFPELAARYRATYAHDANAGARYRDGLQHFFRRLRRKYGIDGWTYAEENETGDQEHATSEAPAQLALGI